MTVLFLDSQWVLHTPAAPKVSIAALKSIFVMIVVVWIGAQQARQIECRRLYWKVLMDESSGFAGLGPHPVS
jgi:hypothetical protein